MKVTVLLKYSNVLYLLYCGNNYSYIGSEKNYIGGKKGGAKGACPS